MTAAESTKTISTAVAPEDMVRAQLYGLLSNIQLTAAKRQLFGSGIDGRRLRVSTQWSAVFDVESREALVCVHRDYSTVYRFRFPDRPVGPN